MSVTDGDIDPDVVIIDFAALAADVQELRISVYPFRSHYTFAGADFAFLITLTIHVNDGVPEVLTYRPQERVFEGVDLIVLRKQNDGQWKREILAGAAVVVSA